MYEIIICLAVNQHSKPRQEMRRFNISGIKFPISKAELLERHGDMIVLIEKGRDIHLKELVGLEMVENFESELELRMFLLKAFQKFQKHSFLIALGGTKILSQLILSIQWLLESGFGFV